MWKTLPILSFACFAVGCSGGSSGADLATTLDMAALAGPDLSLATSGDLAAVADLKMAGGADLASNARHEDLPVAMNPPCFALATGAVTADNPCPADLVFLMGAKVDLQTADSMGAAYCQLPGTFNQFGDVPTDYSMCMWMAYIEGGVGLSNTGFIFRDRASTHHFRARVISNELPHIVFDYAPID